MFNSINFAYKPPKITRYLKGIGNAYGSRIDFDNLTNLDQDLNVIGQGFSDYLSKKNPLNNPASQHVQSVLTGVKNNKKGIPKQVAIGVLDQAPGIVRTELNVIGHPNYGGQVNKEWVKVVKSNPSTLYEAQPISPRHRKVYNYLKDKNQLENLDIPSFSFMSPVLYF